MLFACFAFPCQIRCGNWVEDTFGRDLAAVHSRKPMNTVSESQDNYKNNAFSAAEVQAKRMQSLKDRESMKGLPYDQLIATGTQAQKRKANAERFRTTSTMMLGTSDVVANNARSAARAQRQAADNAASRYGTSAQAANAATPEERAGAVAESKNHGWRRDGSFTKEWKGTGLNYRANTQSVSAQAKAAVAAAK